MDLNTAYNSKSATSSRTNAREDEKVISSLIIAYFNSGVEFDFMNDKHESLKFYKLAYDLSRKELGAGAYLTKTLSERIVRNQ